MPLHAYNRFDGDDATIRLVRFSLACRAPYKKRPSPLIARSTIKQFARQERKFANISATRFGQKKKRIVHKTRSILQVTIFIRRRQNAPPTSPIARRVSVDRHAEASIYRARRLGERQHFEANQKRRINEQKKNIFCCCLKGSDANDDASDDDDELAMDAEHAERARASAINNSERHRP